MFSAKKSHIFSREKPHFLTYCGANIVCTYVCLLSSTPTAPTINDRGRFHCLWRRDSSFRPAMKLPTPWLGAGDDKRNHSINHSHNHLHPPRNYRLQRILVQLLKYGFVSPNSASWVGKVLAAEAVLPKGWVIWGSWEGGWFVSSQCLIKGMEQHPVSLGNLAVPITRTTLHQAQPLQEKRVKHPLYIQLGWDICTYLVNTVICLLS